MTTAETFEREPIAIVGIGCRLPGGADGPDALWRLLSEGFDAIATIPPDRFDVESLYDERAATPGRIMSKWGGFLADVDGFDADFFEIAPREAERLDPQQRLLLETSYEALEDAGLPVDRLAGSTTGVFVGMWLSDFESRLFADPDALDLYMTTGSGRYSSSGRISFFLDLRGPSITIDTACSSSLVAVHLACQSLRSGECEVALAGGANVILEPNITIAYSQARMMAPDGRCKFGDAAADGYVRSDGAAMVVLKRLSTALADGDSIYAVVRGSAVTNDGRSSGFLATPGREGQEEMLRRAYQDAAVDPRTVQYVEAHGTGTAAGDPVELGALGAVVGADRRPGEPCFVGSLKTNVGHTEGAAGVSGLIKVALALHHRELPASLHLHTPNPAIAWDDLGLEVCDRHRPWPVSAGPARGGVSSFGIAGTNAHVVLEAAASVERSSAAGTGRPVLLPISARSPQALHELAAGYRRLLDGGAAPADVAAAAARRRTHHDHRVAVVAATAEVMSEQLAAFERDDPAPGVRTGHAGAPRVAFVFPGQGSQWTGMARELLAEEGAFREAMARCDAAIRAEAGWSVLEQLDAPGGGRLAEIDVIQPTLFAIQVALAAQWRAWGVVPDAVVGHSMGEVAAAHVAGGLSLPDAVAVICRRSRLLKRVAGQGEMAVVDLTVEEAEAAIAGHERHLAVAVSNSPRSTVISGDPGAIDAVLTELEAGGVFCRRVKVDVASHSPQMDPLLDELVAALATLRPQRGDVPMYSTVDAAVVDGSELDSRYWARNLRQPVRFGAMTELLASGGDVVFVEISPHPILLPAVEECLRHGDHAGIGVASLRRAEPERATLLDGLAALWVHGAPVAWDALGDAVATVRLPTYPWQRERFWYEAAAPRVRGGHPFLGQRLVLASEPGTTAWQLRLDAPTLAHLRDHVVRGTAIMPATGFVELALTATELDGAGPAVLTDLALTDVLALADDQLIQVVVAAGVGGSRRVQVFSDGGDGTWNLHASGTLAAETAPVDPDRRSVPAIVARLGAPRPAGDHTIAMSSRGLQYGPAFRPIEELWVGDGEALGRLRLRTAAPSRHADRISVLDGCLQLAVAALAAPTAGQTFVPTAVEHLAVTGTWDDDTELWGHATVTAGGNGRARADVALLDGAGIVVADVRGLDLQRVSRATSALQELAYEVSWPAVARPDETAAEGTWILFAGPGAGSGLAERIRSAGGRCVLVAAGDAYERTGPDDFVLDASAPDLTTLLRDALAGAPCRGIVYAWATGIGTDGIAAAETVGCAVPVALVHALDAVEWPVPPRVWLVTSGAAPVGPRAVVAPQAVLWGLGRVLASERPAWRCTLVDVDPAAAPGDDEALFLEIASGAGDQQVALRGGERTVARLVPRHAPATAPAPPTTVTDEYRVGASVPGVLDSVRPRLAPRRAPGTGEIEIRVDAAGLNFLDVLKAMDAYPGVEADPGVALGAECAGTVVAVGAGVDGLSYGDQVVAITPSYLETSMLASFVTVPAAFAVTRPEHLSGPEAAALPVALLTAYYALHELGRVRRGERVLVHAATGGVGLAAIALCRRAGAEVLATAGSPDKRALLRDLGVEHVFDSRTTSFADEVLAVTGGRGVDIVLNSLVGDAIGAGLAALAPRGRFLEIGKRDVYANRAIGLEPFKKNLSLFVIDLARITDEDPDYVAGLFREVMALVAAGELGPIPVTVAPITEAADAFRTMAQARHTGKLVLAVADAPVEADAPLVRPDGTYLVTGGLGALGLAVAGHLVDRGARHLALLGRRAPSAGAATAIAALEERGADVAVLAADVADHAELDAALKHLATSAPPLRGVVHAAGLLADATLTELDGDRLRAALAPKLAGAWNLHTLTLDQPLDFFVLFSSVAAVLGLPGQANYAAGNAFLDALAHHRRARGLPALSIDWGPWAEVGLAAVQANRGDRLAALGLGSVSPSDALAALDVLLADGDVNPAIVRLDAARWAESQPGAAALLERLLDGAGRPRPASGPGLRATLLAAPSASRRLRLLADAITAELAPVLRLAPERIDRQRPLKAMGLDSLMALELRNRLERATDLTLSAATAFNYPTVEILARHLADRLDLPPEDAARPAERAPDDQAPDAQAPDPQVGAAAADLSQCDLEALLDDELAAVDRLLKAE